MKYVIRYWNQFRKDLKNYRNNKKVLLELKTVLDFLSQWEKIDNKYHDHILSGDMKAYRECHILSDVLLVYKIDKQEIILYCFRLWSHSDLF